MDSSVSPDAGHLDAATEDVGVERDASLQDASALDATPLDAPLLDAPNDAPSADAATSPVVEALSTDFEVREGRFEFLNLDCCSLPTCAGNNPSSPYATYYLPRAPGQTAANYDEEADGTAAAWRMREDEAIIFIGTTPPESAYYGWTSYVLTREGHSIPPFMSLGDTLNQDVIHLAGHGLFNQPTVIIHTSDSITENAVREALVRAGISEASMNTDVLPADDIVMGLDAHSDTFKVIFRVALFANDPDGAAFIANPGGIVLRVTPRIQHSRVALAAPTPRVRGTGASESSELEAALDRLRQAIVATHSDRTPTDVEVLDMTPDPGDCGTRPRSTCVGDNRDATYLGSRLFHMGADEMIVAYGPNHASTGKAVYSNFAVYDIGRLYGVAGIDSRAFPGSAEDYLPGDPMASSLYAWRIARTCPHGDTHCIEIPLTCPGLSLTDWANIAFRAYLEPSTHTGPIGDELVFDRVIRLR